MADDARRAILARRAAFLGSALAAFACNPKQPGSPTAQPTSSTAPTVSVGAADPTPIEVEPAPSTEPSEPQPKASGVPDMSAPPGASPEVAQKYAKLEVLLADTTQFYDELEAAIPTDCGPTNSACESRWQTLAAKVHDERTTMKFFGFWTVACADAPPEVKAYYERVGQLRSYRFARRDRFEERLKQALAQHGGSATAAFDEMVHAARQAKPVPCLSPPGCLRKF